MEIAITTTIPKARAYPNPGLFKTSPRIWAPMTIVARFKEVLAKAAAVA
jgi:hypothetical protein